MAISIGRRRSVFKPRIGIADMPGAVAASTGTFTRPAAKIDDRFGGAR